VIVYMTIGNPDDKLSQREWANYITDMVMLVLEHAAEIHFAGFSHPSAPYQNACWCVNFADEHSYNNARNIASLVRQKYNQASIAWATAQVEFI